MASPRRARSAFHLTAGLEDDGVRGLDGQRSDLRDGFGARLKNHRQQAERAAYLFQFQAGVELGAIENAADGVGQSDDGANACDHGLRACAARASGDRQELSTIRRGERRLRFGDVLRHWRQGSRARSARALAAIVFERMVALLDRGGGDARAACLATCASAADSLALTCAFRERRACRWPCRRRITSRTPGVRPLAMMAGRPASLAMRTASSLVSMPPRPRPLPPRA